MRFRMTYFLFLPLESYHRAAGTASSDDQKCSISHRPSRCFPLRAKKRRIASKLFERHRCIASLQPIRERNKIVNGTSNPVSHFLANGHVKQQLGTNLVHTYARTHVAHAHQRRWHMHTHTHTRTQTHMYGATPSRQCHRCREEKFDLNGMQLISKFVFPNFCRSCIVLLSRTQNKFEIGFCVFKWMCQRCSQLKLCGRAVAMNVAGWERGRQQRMAATKIQINKMKTKEYGEKARAHDTHTPTPKRF